MWSSQTSNDHKPTYRYRWVVLESGVRACWHLQPFWPRCSHTPAPKRHSFRIHQSRGGPCSKFGDYNMDVSDPKLEAMRHIQKAWDTPVAATVYQKILADDTNTEPLFCSNRAQEGPKEISKEICPISSTRVVQVRSTSHNDTSTSTFSYPANSAEVSCCRSDK